MNIPTYFFLKETRIRGRYCDRTRQTSILLLSLTQGKVTFSLAINNADTSLLVRGGNVAFIDLSTGLCWHNFVPCDLPSSRSSSATPSVATISALTRMGDFKFNQALEILLSRTVGFTPKTSLTSLFVQKQELSQVRARYTRLSDISLFICKQ